MVPKVLIHKQKLLEKRPGYLSMSMTPRPVDKDSTG